MLYSKNMIQHAPKPPEPSSFRGFDHYDTMALIEFKVTVRGTLIRNSVLAAAGAAAVRSHLPHAQDTVENCVFSVLASSRNSQ